MAVQQKLQTSAKSKFFTALPLICLSNLKFFACIKSNCFSVSKIHFAAPWTLLPGAAAPLAPP
jgi:hypothetical protein